MANLADLFPNASASFLTRNRGNILDLSKGTTPKLKRPLRDAALGEVKAKKRDTGFYVVRLTSYRCRLLDTDNLCGKYHTDVLRYAGILHADSPETCRIETRQEKVKKKEDQRTLIEITRHEIHP